MEVNRHLFDQKVYIDYRSFIGTLFEEPKSGPDREAKIRSVVQHDRGGNRRKHGTYTWQEQWYDAFSEPGKQAQAKFIDATYEALMESLTDSLGVEPRRTNKARRFPKRSTA